MEMVNAELEAYALTNTSAEEPLLAELTEETQRTTQFPKMQSGHVEGLLLRTLVQVSGARLVVELGTFTGYSALSMAMGLPEDGKIITCDVDIETTAIAKRYWTRSPHGSKIDLRLGPALETIESLDGPFDLVFIDADKQNYVNYWEACLPKVRTGGLIVADNVLWDGRVLDPREANDFAIVGFNEHVLQDDRVESVMLTVRDGVTLARKL